jgi:hypothetical protein
MDDQYGAQLGQYNLRPRKERDYSHLFTQLVLSPTMVHVIPCHC